MAAADICSPLAPGIPGLNEPLHYRDLANSCPTYNGLPNIKDQAVDLKTAKYAQHIKNLLAIIGHHGLLGFLGVHSAHRHDGIPDDTVRLETNMGPDAKGITWTRATSIKQLTMDGAPTVHGIFFKATKGGQLVPVEYAEGASPAGSTNITPEFVTEFVGYIDSNGLHDIFVLQTVDLDDKNLGRRVEIEVQWGKYEAFTVSVPDSVRVKSPEATLVPTGWFGPDSNLTDPDGEPPAGEHWNEVVVGPKKTHKVHYDGVEPVTAQGVIQLLTSEGVIRA